MESLNSPRRAVHSDPLTFGDLIERLGDDVTLVTPLLDPAQHVAGTEFLDAAGDPGDVTGLFAMIVLAERLPLPAVEALIARAAAGGCGAVAMRVPGEHEAEVLAAAEAAGIALVRVAPHVSWRKLDAFISSLLAEHDQGIGDPGSEPSEPLYALADTVAEVFGGSVAVEDLSRNVLAYSSVPGQLIDSLRTRGILTRRVPLTPQNDDQYQVVLRAEGPVAFPTLDDEFARTAIAIRAGTVPLGTVWAIDADPGAQSEERERRERVLQDAANVAAGHLMRSWQVWGANRRPRENVLRRLLDGTNLVGSEWIELGVPPEGDVTLIAVTARGASLSGAGLTQAHTSARRHFETFRTDSVTTALDGTVWILLTDATAQEARRLVERLMPLLGRVLDRPAVAAIVPAARHSGSLTGERTEAAAVLRSAERTGLPVATRDDVLPRLVVDAVVRTLGEDPLLADPRFDRLAAASGGVIAAAVLAWCDQQGNVAATAKSLGVHENTVRYRLNRAAEKYGVTLDTPDERLVAWLRLRAQTATPR